MLRRPLESAVRARHGHVIPRANLPQADLTVIDPVMTTAYITRYHATMVWDQLYGIDSLLQPQPRMVEGHVWPVTDTGSAFLTPAQLSMLLEGMDWRAPVRPWRLALASSVRGLLERPRREGRGLNSTSYRSL